MDEGASRGITDTVPCTGCPSATLSAFHKKSFPFVPSEPGLIHRALIPQLVFTLRELQAPESGVTIKLYTSYGNRGRKQIISQLSLNVQIVKESHPL